MTSSNSNPLAEYSRSNVDKLYADSRESLFGHLVVERGKSVKAAIEELRPNVKQALKTTEVAANWCQKLGIGGVGLGVLVGASTMGIAYAALPILAGCLSLKLWADSRDEMPRREAEYHLLRECSNLPEALYALHLRGVNTAVLVGAYDSLISAVEARLERGAEFTGSEVGQFLEAKIKALATIAPVATQSQQGIQPIGELENNVESPRAKDETLGVSGIQPIGIAQDAIKAIAPSMQHITSPVWNPAQDLGENPQSALIVGVPGSGKGMLVSNAIRTLKNKHPDLTVFVVDPKADPKERGYWEGLADRYEAFSLMKCSDPDEGAEWLLSCMAEFTALPGPKLCIFDELMSASTELTLANKELKAIQRLKKFVVGLIGQGDSQGAWLWAMTQSPQVSDMGMSGGVRANLRAIGLVSPKNLAAVEALVSTNLIPKPPGGMDELRQIMKASPVGRAVFDGKLARWLPMPRLENHSGFDRDNRKIHKEQPIAPPSSTAIADISDTWREDFAKSLPPNLSESEFKQRYELEQMLRESSSLEPQTWSTAPAENVEQQPIDLGIEACYEIISGEPDDDLKQALMIGFDWFIKDKRNGRELTKETFLNRAKTNRKSLKLKEDRQSIWNELEELITYYDGL